MLSTRLEQMLNDQIAHELLNSKKYRVICAWLRREGYEGLASYFSKWSKEELDHADWVQDYLMNRNACVDIPETDAVEMSFKSVLEIAEYVMDTEVETTRLLYQIMEASKMENDYMTCDFIQTRMVHEQVEEEDKAQTLLDLAIKAKDNVAMLMMIDEKYED